jgi:hypothetical protein
MIFLDLPTELLCRILSYLPAIDLCTAQWTCHKINRIITDTVYFRYIFRAYISGVDDLLPPDCPFPERLELLKQYENSWSNLQLNKSDEFPISIQAPNSHYTLQDGYLIYKANTGTNLPLKYGYLDLFSVVGNQEAWVHIPMQDSDTNMRHLGLTFAVDHDLVILSRFVLPNAFLSAKPDKCIARHEQTRDLNLHNSLLTSLNLLRGHPIRYPRCRLYPFCSPSLKSLPILLL